jgi:hypothetical protein
MGRKRSKLVLGYTREGHAVLLPTCRTPDADHFVSWTRGDHIDASRILQEHGERETDPTVGTWCESWANTHRRLSSRRRKKLGLVRGAVELAIRVKGR